MTRPAARPAVEASARALELIAPAIAQAEAIIAKLVEIEGAADAEQLDWGDVGSISHAAELLNRIASHYNLEGATEE